MNSNLIDLAAQARTAHERYHAAVSAAVDHAMKCGEICWQVREQNAQQVYDEWLASAGLTIEDAAKYIAAWMGQAMQAMVGDFEARRDRICRQCRRSRFDYAPRRAAGGSQRLPCTRRSTREAR